ncbi:hypothetical protein OROGR_031496 [Orobanche gracilis]
MFPRFDGREAWGWLISVEQYCEAKGIAEEKKFSEAEKSLCGSEPYMPEPRPIPESPEQEKMEENSEVLEKESEANLAPPRADVLKSLRNGIVVNLLGMAAAILGMQATVGLLVAKALTASGTPYYQGIPPGSTPVLALDVFLVQASANTILSHFIGLACSMELLRSVTLPPAEPLPTSKFA